MKLRLLKSDWDPFVRELCSRSDVETAGIIFAERLHDKCTLLARELLIVPDDAYVIRQRDRIRIDPIAFNRLVRPARDRGLSVFTVHTHPKADSPWFSMADDTGDSVLMPSLLSQIPGPHGSLVVAGNTQTACARAWTTAENVTDVSLHIIGQSLHVMSADNMDNQMEWFDRQRLALGESGQCVLRKLHIAVVGLGGTGSATFTQLVHLGVGEITVIDGDIIESSNVSRIFGATTDDADVTWKVDAAARYAKAVGLNTKVNKIRGNLGQNVETTDIEDCDAIFSCVDSHLPRALLNRLSYDKAIFLIDMGSAFRVSHSTVTAGSGRVVVLGPGRPCLACWGHIDSNRIRTESLPEDERAQQSAEGYISGAEVPQPSVIAFNTLISGAAVIELLRTVTGFSEPETAPLRLGFDFMTGTVRRNRLSDTPGCRICQPKLVHNEHDS